MHGVAEPTLNVAIGGIASGSYVSGITATGTGTCILTFLNGATATVPVASGTVTVGALTFTASGQGSYVAPTTATVSNGTASACASSTISIASWTASGATLTFSATNTLTAGQQVILTGFTGGSTWLNGQTVTVLSSGLSGSAFRAMVTGIVGTTAAGTADVAYVTTTLNTPSQLVGGSIITPGLGMNGSHVEVDHLGFDDGPTLQTGNAQNTLVISCTNGSTLACGHDVSVHDVITLGNSSTAVFHGALIGEGYDNCYFNNIQSYWNEDGFVTKCTHLRATNIISKGHLLGANYVKSDFYAPLGSATLTNILGGVITPGDTAYGFLVQALDAPASGITFNSIQADGTTNGIEVTGGTTSVNTLSGVTFNGVTINGVSGQGFLSSGYVNTVNVNGYAITGSGGWADITFSASPNVTNFVFGPVASDSISSGGCLNGPTNRVATTYGVTSAECSTSLLSSPSSKIQLMSPSSAGWVITGNQTSFPGGGCTGTISTTTFTCTTLLYGTIAVGDIIGGNGVLSGYITALGTGTGGTGTYTISTSQTVSAAQSIYAVTPQGGMIAPGGLSVNGFDVIFSTAPVCTSAYAALYIYDVTQSSRFNFNYILSASTATATIYRTTGTTPGGLLNVQPGDVLSIENGSSATSCTAGQLGTISELDLFTQPY
jgi:hypothetical protein